MTPMFHIGEGDLGEDALQPAGLLQDERAVAFGAHDDPAEAHRVHVAGLVHAGHRVEAVDYYRRRRRRLDLALAFSAWTVTCNNFQREGPP